MPGLLKLNLAICFCLDHRNDLGISLHHFGLSQNTSTSRKVLKAHADLHQVIAVGGVTPSLSDTSTLMSQDGVSLSATLTMARGPHTRLRVVLVALLRLEHPTMLTIKEVNK